MKAAVLIIIAIIILGFILRFIRRKEEDVLITIKEKHYRLKDYR